jgi:DNA-binding XRE family transcriptional regulator
MQHQDLEQVVWNKKNNYGGGPVKINPPGTKVFHQLDGNEPPVPEHGNRTLSIQIQQARSLKKWKQVDLAKRLNVLPTFITKIENGSVLPTKKQIRDMESALGVKFM